MDFSQFWAELLKGGCAPKGNRYSVVQGGTKLHILSPGNGNTEYHITKETVEEYFRLLETKEMFSGDFKVKKSACFYDVYNYVIKTYVRVVTRCPYTLQSLDSLKNPSREHIIPDALGGSNAYSVKADRDKNSLLGSTTDAKLINSEYVTLIRSRLGIETRTGVSSWKVNGKLESGVPVEFESSKDGVKLHIKKPVHFTSENTATIIATPEDTERKIEEFIKGQQRKGRRVVCTEIGRTEMQKIHLNSSFSLTEINTGLLKIAYLAVFHQIGDEFLNDPLNKEWLKAIDVRTFEKGEVVRLTHFSDYSLCSRLFPHLDENQHCIIIFDINGIGPFVGVRLFGCKLLTIVVKFSETSRYGIDQNSGNIIIIDTKTQTLSELPFEQVLMSTYSPISESKQISDPTIN